MKSNQTSLKSFQSSVARSLKLLFRARVAIRIWLGNQFLKGKNMILKALIFSSTTFRDFLQEQVAGYVKASNSRVMLYESISNYRGREGTLLLHPLLKGGVLQRWKSKPMKKDDALMALVVRSKEGIVTRLTPQSSLLRPTIRLRARLQHAVRR